MRTAAALLGVAVSVGGGVARAQPAAPAPDRQQCVDAYESAQLAMRRAQLSRAREKIHFCLQDSCAPLLGALRADCAQWLRDVDARQPTIVLEMKGARGEALTDVKVTSNGRVLTEHIDGRGIEIDPGEYELEFLARGERPIKQKFVVKEGEKLQRLTASLPRKDEPVDRGAAQLRVSLARPVPWTVYALGGLGIAAAGGFAYFGLSGLDRKDGLEACKPECPHDDVTGVRTRFIVADVMLAVSAVSLAAAGVILFTRPTVQVNEAGRAPSWLGGTF
jgi:hypothetical protein